MFAILISEANRATIEEQLETSQNPIAVAPEYYSSKKNWYYVSGMTFPFRDPHIQDTIMPEFRFKKTFDYDPDVKTKWITVFPK